MAKFKERRSADRRRHPKYHYRCEVHGILDHHETHNIGDEIFCMHCISNHFQSSGIQPVIKTAKDKQ